MNYTQWYRNTMKSVSWVIIFKSLLQIQIVIHTKAKNDILSFNYGYFCYNTDKITVFRLKGNSRFKLQKRLIQEQKVLPTF